MFDTATTALYNHPTDGQPARGLFGNLTLPSSLPSQLIQLPLGLFSQRQQQQQQPSPQQIENNALKELDNSNNNNNSSGSNNTNKSSAITPPAPPLLPPQTANKRTSRRTRNHGAVTTVAAQQKAGQAQQPQPNPGNNQHVSTRRKRLSNKMNRNLIDQAITFSAIAVEEDQQGNHQCALDLYLDALESMLYAMPIHTDADRREAVKEKLRDFINQVGLADELSAPKQSSVYRLRSGQVDHNAVINAYANGKPGRSGTSPSISEHVINAAISSAVALKQSPIPDAISATVNYTMRKVKQIDETYGLQEKAWEISRSGINLALEIDQQYNVHEKVGNALFTGLAAAMKAGIAYKDSPSYRELKRIKAEYLVLRDEDGVKK